MENFVRYLINTNQDLIIQAMFFRFKNKKQNLSVTDCIGYFMAKELKIKFLTGDNQFASLDNAEFVK